MSTIVWHAKRCNIRYFYRILLHYYCIFWDLYLISGHFYSICFVSILYSMICSQYIRLFLLYNFRLYFIFSHLHCIFLDLYLISGLFCSILLHYYCIFGFVFNIWPFLLIRFYSIFYDLYLISIYFYCIIFVYIVYSVICIVYFWICI